MPAPQKLPIKFTQPGSADFDGLKKLAAQRAGGSFMFRGAWFQVLFSLWKVLFEFGETSEQGDIFQLEGVEDLDFHKGDGSVEHIQVKCFNQNLGADGFTREILSNFLKAFEKAPEGRLTVALNVHIQTGFLKDLEETNREKKSLSSKTFAHWAVKIRLIQPLMNEDECRAFLSTISFLRMTEADLEAKISRLLIERFQILNGNETLYLAALAFFLFGGAKDRRTVSKNDLLQIIQNTTDNIEKGPVNLPAREGWIQLIDFKTPAENRLADAYFEGKAARPSHIAADLPVVRADWEKQILADLNEWDVVVIKSASGQGKSTLAWRVARQMMGQGGAIFELQELRREGIEDLIRFFESRIRCGLLPLVVIDGLCERTSDWAELARRCQQLRGVKFLLTSREEDWFKYGQQTADLLLKPVAITLSRDEARAIFLAFQKRQKLHPGVRNWESAWEKVQHRQLLIEYVFLLTNGQMLHDRLVEQLAELRNDPNEAAKKTLLRAVSVADLLQIRLPTSRLLRFVKEKTGFVADNGTLMESLQNEYHIQFEGREMVEGLHPIRSGHLSDLLHKALPVAETLIDLLEIIEPETLFAFASESPFLIENEAGRSRFLEKLAEAVAPKTYREIVETVYGIYASDAHQWFLINRETLDEAVDAGQELYVYQKVPFTGAELSFDVVSKVNPEFQKRMNRLTDAEIGRSNVAAYLSALRERLNGQPAKRSLERMAHFERWLERFGPTLGLFEKLTAADLAKAIDPMPLDQVGELLYGAFLLNMPLFERFYEVHGENLLDRLRIETETLTLLPQNYTLEMRYIVEQNNGISIKEQSNRRMKTIAYCLPNFSNYRLTGLYFPTPLIEEMVARHDESVMSAEGSGWLRHDVFWTRGNMAWSNRVLDNYRFQTNYEWQEYFFEYRKMALEFVRQTTRCFEKLLASVPFTKEQNRLAEMFEVFSRYKKKRQQPRYEEEHFSEERFKGEVNKVDEWEGQFQIVRQQTFPDITKDDYCRLYKINTRTAFQKLAAMQAGFEEIARSAGQYFETCDLIEAEKTAFDYFADLIEYAMTNWRERERPTIPKVREAVRQWKNSAWGKEQQLLEQARLLAETLFGFELILPDFYLEDDLLKSAVIGVRCEMTDEFSNEYLLNLLCCLTGLTEARADFIHIVWIIGNKTGSGNSIRISKEFLRQAAEMVDGQRTVFERQIFPIPLTAEILMPLKGIELKEPDPMTQSAHHFLCIQEALWRFSETRERLKEGNDVAQKWKNRQLFEMKKQIAEHLRSVESHSTDRTWHESQTSRVTIDGQFFGAEKCKQAFERLFRLEKNSGGQET